MEGHGNQFVMSITWCCFDKRHDSPVCQGLELASAGSSKKIPSIILFLGICGAVFTGYLFWQIKADKTFTAGYENHILS